MSVKETVKENLIRLRREHKLTQLELSEKINYSDKAVSRWETGEVTPDVETLESLASLYGIPITSFFFPVGEKLSKKERKAQKRAVKLQRKREKKTVEAPKKKQKDPAKQYRSGILDRIPATVKALFIKFWFNGAVCYFIFWGLGMYVNDMLDMIVAMAIVLGMVTDILTNNALRFVETLPYENNKWMMFPKKKYWTFIANIFYAFLVLFCVVWLYESINGVVNALKGTENVVYLGVEPIFFGIFYVLFDLLFIGMKNLFKIIINDAKDKVNKQ